MTSGGREALKWLALVLMTGDHLNKTVLGGQFLGLTDAARVVFPIFALVLAYNLVRPGAIVPAFNRLAIAAAIVQPFHASAFGYGLPINVLATFAVAVAMMGLWLSERRILALVVGLAASPWVDYGPAGVALTFATWLWLRGEGRTLPAALAALAGICVYNGNGWALLALPLIWILGRIPADLPRWRWTFLGYYVGHLVVLATISGGMDVAGNLADPVGTVAGSPRTNG